MRLDPAMCRWTCTFCWTRNGSLRFTCKQCGQPKHGNVSPAK